MTARRRSRRRRPLTEFARRSPLHAFAAWFVRSALILLIGLAVWMYVSNVAIPDLANRMAEQMQSR